MNDSLVSNKTQIEELTYSALRERYESLKQRYQGLSSNFEAINQELHETRRSYETSLEIQSDMRADLDLYKVEDQKQKNELLSHITALQEEISTLRNERSEIAERNASNVSKLRAENRRLKEERAIVSRKSPERDCNEVDEINNELSTVLFESASAKAANEEARAEIVSWRMKFEELMTEIGELRAAADIRKEEMKNAEEREAVALAELAETRSMLHQVGGVEQDAIATKGNSIFSEVEDKRQEIAKNLLQMKQSNSKLRQEIANKQAEIEALLHEKQTIWEEQAGATAHYDRELIDSYENRVTQLKALSERHRREICRWFGKPADPTVPGWLPELIDHWKVECETLRGELLSQTPARIANATLLRELRRKTALMTADTRKQSPVPNDVDKNEISVYKVPEKTFRNVDAKKKVSFN